MSGTKPRWVKYDFGQCDACRREVVDEQVVSFFDEAQVFCTMCRACATRVASFMVKGPPKPKKRKASANGGAT